MIGVMGGLFGGTSSEVSPMNVGALPAIDGMHAMIRWLFTFASAVSLLLALTTAALWVRSYTTGDVFDVWWGPVVLPGGRTPEGAVYGDAVISRRFGVSSVRGALLVATGATDAMDRHRRIEIYHNRLSMDWPQPWPLFSFAAGHRDRLIPELPLFDLTLPHALLVAIFMISPAVWWFRFRRRRRGVSGLCPVCGYDLRASNERCPECGTPIPSNAKATT